MNQVITPQAVQELAQLAGIHLSPERLERLAARLAAFYRDMAVLEQLEVGELHPDFAQPLEESGR